MRKLEFENDAFAFGDKLVEKWYETVEQGGKKGVLVVVTTGKDGALTGGPDFMKARSSVAQRGHGSEGYGQGLGSGWWSGTRRWSWAGGKKGVLVVVIIGKDGALTGGPYFMNPT